MRRVALIIGSHEVSEFDSQVLSPAILPKSDRAAIGLAMQRFGGQVQAYCLRQDEAALRYALAAGASTAAPLDDIAGLDVDVVLVGRGGAGPWGDLILALLAEHKQCAMVVDVLDVELCSDGIAVTRDLGGGSREVLGIRGPAVLGVSEEAVQLLYVSRYRRQAVSVSLPEPKVGLMHDPLAAVSGPWAPTRPRVRAGNLAAKTGGSASERMQALMGMTGDVHEDDARPHVIRADAATCAQHLLRFLSHQGVIAGAITAPVVPVSPEAKKDGGSQELGPSIPTRRGRGPQPLRGEARGLSRRPRPLQDDVALSPQPQFETRLRGPRPVGQAAPRRGRGPRPV